jgi:hypothetical protein
MLEATIKLNVGLSQPEIFKALIAYCIPDPVHGHKEYTDWLAFSNNVRARLSVSCNSAPGDPWPCVTIFAQTNDEKINLLQVIHDAVDRLHTYGLKEAKYIKSNDVCVAYTAP